MFRSRERGRATGTVSVNSSHPPRTSAGRGTNAFVRESQRIRGLNHPGQKSAVHSVAANNVTPATRYSRRDHHPAAHENLPVAHGDILPVRQAPAVPSQSLRVALLSDRFAVEQCHDQCLLHFTGLKPKGTSTALIGHSACRIDDVQSRGHAAVGISRRIVDFIDQQWNKGFSFRIGIAERRRFVLRRSSAAPPPRRLWRSNPSSSHRSDALRGHTLPGTPRHP